MQAAIAAHVMRLQYSYSDLSRAEHEAMGPDALDTALWAMTPGIDFGIPRPSKQPQAEMEMPDFQNVALPKIEKKSCVGCLNNDVPDEYDEFADTE